ncbi:MAG: hypothetical protein WBB70_04800 [Desulfobacterales bacterium]
MTTMTGMVGRQRCSLSGWILDYGIKGNLGKQVQGFIQKGG